ncbi:MAG: LPS export ABC transporter periplasmic protein LptC [Candidatus Competibacteraceae bacterium]|nr:LPS export ABC transporter periplasmic protein LptC [Candidatus Competibacteraceae bacterium]MCB1821569.1 LPS export ABC transporter periplasmic protein LptC [Candidatus Competibacteraceae bacterium]MCP5127145.1 LPS export ABC transporter periplasmic protein LptC [Gammaproteobacteria bacterium]
MTVPPSITARGIFSLTVLALLAGLSYGLLQWVESGLREPERAKSQEPVMIINHFQAVRLNTAGVREYVVEAPQLAQLPDKLGARIEWPVLDWYQLDGQTREWRLQSEQGWVAADYETVRLEGAVTMTRLATSGKPPVTVTTRDVLIRPGERYVETAAPARAITPGGELRAVGVRAWLDQERLELLSQVRGTYDPPKP